MENSYGTQETEVWADTTFITEKSFILEKELCGTEHKDSQQNPDITNLQMVINGCLPTHVKNAKIQPHVQC